MAARDRSNKPFLGTGRATPYCTFTAASAAAGYPASNLGSLPLGQVWQSTGTTGQWIKGEYDVKRPVQLFLLCRHEHANGDTFRLRLFEDAAATQAATIYDSDTDAGLPGGNEFWPEVYGDTLEWEDPNWMDGRYTEEEKAGTVWFRPVVLDKLYLARSWRLDLTAPYNTAGYFRFGMIESARGHWLSRGVDFNAEDDYDARTGTVTAYGGADYHNRLIKKRLARVSFNRLARDEAKGVIQELYRQMDLDTPFAWIPDPTDTRHWLRDVGLYKLERLSPLQRASVGYHSANLSLKEAF